MTALDSSGTLRATGAMDRRAFLKISAAVASPFVARARQARGAAADPVVVVGAGLAGLRAAEVLRIAGAPVVVLEARSRPGGRVITARCRVIPIEGVDFVQLTR